MPKKGYKQTDEHRRKIKVALNRPEVRMKSRINAIRQFQDPRQREEQSKRLKERYRNPEERKKQSERMKYLFLNRPEIRVKMSESALKRWENPKERGRQSRTIRGKLLRKGVKNVS